MKSLRNKVANKIRLYKRRKHRTNVLSKTLSALPRLIVNRSNAHIRAQIVDRSWNVLVSIHDLSLSGTKSAKAFEAWRLIWEKALALGVTSVVFDRNGYLYHGRVSKLAQWAREAGLQF